MCVTSKREGVSVGLHLHVPLCNGCITQLLVTFLRLSGEGRVSLFYVERRCKVQVRSFMGYVSGLAWWEARRKHRARLKSMGF
ncbi:hypothetical protein BDA96_02G252200 [Sorghum bicolor]|uniref:Uncharacterized protein n=1 Tax=Sorghum bicolor TaxID=4558 RepID=A0A921RRN5_SORBI|nr:hypothetical protein BDA96_02G252200 [Sorghum bicolor]